MEHFIFLLEKFGFEVNQGKHIAVKAPGMKRFKRLDTISEDFSRENSEVVFRNIGNGKCSDSYLEKGTNSVVPIRKAILTPYQRKCYVRMYRVHVAKRKRFTYRTAQLYEQIRKMHELQEEYLLTVDYNVHSYGDLFKLRDRLKGVNEELCNAQKEMYRERGVQKRFCKTYKDVVLFEENETEYRERLDAIKLLKKENIKKLKIVGRCIGKETSALEAELERRMPVYEFEDINNIVADKIPENPFVSSCPRPSKDEYMSVKKSQWRYLKENGLKKKQHKTGKIRKKVR